MEIKIVFFTTFLFLNALRSYVAAHNVTVTSNDTATSVKVNVSDVMPTNVTDEAESAKQHTKKSVLDGGGFLIPLPPPPPLHPASPSLVVPALLQPPPIYAAQKYPGAYVPNVYTRVKLGYGTFYYNGRDAELRCNFPYNLKINSNFVWNKVTDNVLHFLDVYRVYERTYGHVSSLYVRDVQPKDFGIYACAVSGSFYPDHPVTFYQEVYFFPPVTYSYG